MTGFDSKRQMAANKLQEIFCGVDYADGVLAVSVMRRSPDGVAELLHSEQIELAQPAQEPVAWQWLGSAHFRKKLPKNADITAWNPLYANPPKGNT